MIREYLVLGDLSLLDQESHMGPQQECRTKRDRHLPISWANHGQAWYTCLLILLFEDGRGERRSVIGSYMGILRQLVCWPANLHFE